MGASWQTKIMPIVAENLHRLRGIKPPALLPVLPLVALCFASCRDTSVVLYRVPKANPAATATAFTAVAPAQAEVQARAVSIGAPMADPKVAVALSNDLTWIAPSRWVAKPAGGMRKGSYTVNGAGGVTADVAITAFPGDVGGEVANLNRWRGQIKLPPLTAAAAATAITRLEVNGLKIAFVDLVNPAAAVPNSLLGAMVPVGGNTWFFKMLGPDALVARERPAVIALLQTVTIAAQATPVAATAP